MKSPTQVLAFLSLLGVALLWSGCRSRVSNYDVWVDALTAQPGTGGTSFRLVSSDPTAYRDPEVHSLIERCVAAALETRGLFIAPPNVAPELLVAIDYGTGNSVRLGARGPLQEIFLSISARKNPGDRSEERGEEMWNVRVSMANDQARLIVVGPVLASVAADHAGTDTAGKQEIRVSDQAPGVTMVRRTLGILSD